MLPCSHSPPYDALLSVQFVVSVEGDKSFFKATTFEKEGISLLWIYFSVCLWKIFLLKVESSIKGRGRDNHPFTLVFIMASHVGRQHNGAGSPQIYIIPLFHVINLAYATII